MAVGKPRQRDRAVGAHLQKGHRPALRHLGGLRGGCHRVRRSADHAALCGVDGGGAYTGAP